MPQSNLVRRVAIAATLIGVGALVTWLLLGSKAPFDDEDDPPPIIINNGSVQVNALGSSSAWTQITARPNGLYEYQHDKKGSGKLIVRVAGTSTPDCKVKLDKVDKLDLSFGEENTTSTFSLYTEKIGSDYFLRVKTDDLNVTMSGGLLEVGGAGWLKNVKVFDNNNKPDCAFAKDSFPLLVIEHKK